MLFGKKKISGEQKELADRAESLPNKKIVQFTYIKPKELESQLDADINSVLSLEPSNYYASKDRFYDCIFYYDEIYTQIIMQFQLIEYDKKTFDSKYYPVTLELLSQTLMKFGIRISF
ncbi:MAG: hypothetical protein NC203_06125 [Firmicutes bacterium]|nr:hypothetical protein [[Eubacterium] siraeum]MCM1487927.1 hypothetical protein [Bacillota bacterium]